MGLARWIRARARGARTKERRRGKGKGEGCRGSCSIGLSWGLGGSEELDREMGMISRRREGGEEEVSGGSRGSGWVK